MKFRMHHAAISVKSMQESIDYYAQFGFKDNEYRYKDPEGDFEIAQLKLADSFLELFWFRNQQEAPETASALSTDLPRIGAKHFALQVEDIEDTKTWVEERGLATQVEVMEGKTGVRYFFIKDINGILFEFIEDHREL